MAVSAAVPAVAASAAVAEVSPAVPAAADADKTKKEINKTTTKLGIYEEGISKRIQIRICLNNKPTFMRTILKGIR